MGVNSLLYDCILTLRSGEIISIPEVRNISWTRARVIFTNADEESVHFLSGEIVDCHLFIRKGVE